jgi:hypothetical protein
MRNLNVKVHVPPDRKVLLQLPDEVDLGDVELTVIVRPRRSPTHPKPSLVSRLPDVHIDHWPADATYSRADIYGDDGR